jgi:hypothetical protein
MERASRDRYDGPAGDPIIPDVDLFPGVHFGDDVKARALARRVNEEGARLCEAHGKRFGFFASLPLPDLEGAVAEACYALDVLEADGVVLKTSHHGIYLGDDRLSVLFDELNRRKAVIFIHPTSPACSCCSGIEGKYPKPMLEFIFETTRSVVDMVAVRCDRTIYRS